MRTAKLGLALVILVAVFIFSVNNAQSVEIVFLRYRTPPLPLFLIVIVIFLLGLLLASLLGTLRSSRLRRRIHLPEKEIEGLRRERSEGRGEGGNSIPERSVDF